MTNAAKIRVMIYLIFVQYVKHRMQITQECWEYNLTINSVKFCKKTCNKRLHHYHKMTVVFVANTYCSSPI